MLGFPNAPVQLIKTENTPKKENIYSQVTEIPKADHHPKMKNTDLDDDSVHSQDAALRVVFKHSA